MDCPLLFIDVETATRGGAPHMLELAAVRVVDGEAQEHFESLVCPEVEIDGEATLLHGIDAEAVRLAPEPAAVLAEFGQWAGEDWLLAHDAAAVARVLGFEYARRGIDPPAGPVLCAQALARRCLAEAPDFELDALAAWLELEAGVSHRALADAVTCWKVVEACLERLAQPGGAVGAAELWTAAGVPLNIAGAGPARPRPFPQRLRRLERARAEGRAVTLVYGEASQGQPAHLPVQPRLLWQGGERGYLEAECLLSGLIKTYRLDRIQRVLPRREGARSEL